MIPVARAAVVAGVVLLATLAAASSASAHTELIASTPADGATVASLDVVTLEFSATVLEVGSEMSVTDSTGALTPLSITQPSAAVIEAQVPPLANGAVLVTWRAVAEDGHPIEGTLTVNLDAAVSDPSTAPPTAATPTAVASPSATPGADDGDMTLGTPEWWMWVIIAIAIIGSGAAAIVAATRRNTPPAADAE